MEPAIGHSHSPSKSHRPNQEGEYLQPHANGSCQTKDLDHATAVASAKVYEWVNNRTRAAAG